MMTALNDDPLDHPNDEKHGRLQIAEATTDPASQTPSIARQSPSP